MSPIAEKLAAVLADWDEMVVPWPIRQTNHSQGRGHHQSSAAIHPPGVGDHDAARKISVLEMQVADAVLMATDPDDAKLLSQIEAAYATLAPRAGATSGNGAHARKHAGSGGKNGFGEIGFRQGNFRSGGDCGAIAVTLSPPVASPGDVPSPVAKSSGDTAVPQAWDAAPPRASRRVAGCGFQAR